jgi:hypothetical protein
MLPFILDDLSLKGDKMTNPTKFTWTDPTTNVDGSAISTGEITGYNVGVRLTTATGSVAGTYPIMAAVSGAAAANELISALGTVLIPGAYAAAVQAVGPVNSAWSAEATFTIAPPVPNSPTNFTVA